MCIWQNLELLVFIKKGKLKESHSVSRSVGLLIHTYLGIFICQSHSSIHPSWGVRDRTFSVELESYSIKKLLPLPLQLYLLEEDMLLANSRFTFLSSKFTLRI